MVLYTLSLALVPSGDSDSSQTKISFHGRLLDWEYQDVLSYSAKPLGSIFNNTCSFCIPLKQNFPHYHPCSADSNVMDSAGEQCGMRRTRIHTELSCSNPWPLWWGCCNSRGEAQSQSEPLHMNSLVSVDKLWSLPEPFWLPLERPHGDQRQQISFGSGEMSCGTLCLTSPQPRLHK